MSWRVRGFEKPIEVDVVLVVRGWKERIRGLAAVMEMHRADGWEHLGHRRVGACWEWRQSALEHYEREHINGSVEMGVPA